MSSMINNYRLLIEIFR